MEEYKQTGSPRLDGTGPRTIPEPNQVLNEGVTVGVQVAVRVTGGIGDPVVVTVPVTDDVVVTEGVNV